MKLRLLKNSSIALLIIAFICVCPNARADWGSVRANNRSPHGHEEHHRHRDLEADRRQACYWSALAPGMTVATLPAGSIQVSAGVTGYDYYDGVYFQPVTSLSSGYVVVAPPVGAVVPQLPTGAEAVADGNATYYYAGGAFYLQEANGFVVMPAPMGVVVTMLPAGSTPMSIKGVLYYVAGNNYYEPAMLGGVTVYTTARP